MLPDSHFIETLANEHKTVFEKIAEKLKEFFEQIKTYFKDLVYNPSTEANALKENIDGTVKYIDDIVTKFDAAAVDAVENYQEENAVDADNVNDAVYNVSKVDKGSTMKWQKG